MWSLYKLYIEELRGQAPPPIRLTKIEDRLPKLAEQADHLQRVGRVSAVRSGSTIPERSARIISRVYAAPPVRHRGRLAVGLFFALLSTWLRVQSVPSAPLRMHEVPEHSENPRRAIRIGLDAQVSIRRAAEHYRTAQLKDLSSHGCSVELAARVNLDETVWIKLSGMEARQGLVCWVKDYTCGIDFDAPLHPAVMDMLALRLGGPQTSK